MKIRNSIQTFRTHIISPCTDHLVLSVLVYTKRVDVGKRLFKL